MKWPHIHFLKWLQRNELWFMKGYAIINLANVWLYFCFILLLQIKTGTYLKLSIELFKRRRWYNGRLSLPPPSESLSGYLTLTTAAPVFSWPDLSAGHVRTRPDRGNAADVKSLCTIMAPGRPQTTIPNMHRCQLHSLCLEGGVKTHPSDASPCLNHQIAEQKNYNPRHKSRGFANTHLQSAERYWLSGSHAF